MILRYYILLALFLLMSCGFGTYSEGYRMGQLTKLSKKGIINKSIEGHLNMGHEGTPISGEDGEDINPWKFSSDPDTKLPLQKYSAKYCVIGYSQMTFANPFKYDTDYLVKSLYPIKNKYPKNLPFIESQFKSNEFSSGFRVGRFVKASYKGNIKKTYEVMLQIGDSGNLFKRMSVISEDMYKNVLTCLMSGKKYNIHYIERGIFDFSIQNTNYVITEIDSISNI